MGCPIFTPIKNLIRGRSSKPKVRIVMVGLDTSGKTTMLYSLRLAEVVTTIPTIGFNVETLSYKNTLVNCWDVGGCDKLRPLWKSYFKDADGLIFVVDSTDRVRLVEAREELQRFVAHEELRGIPLLVYANKQDLPDAMGLHQLTDALGLASMEKREWTIKSASFIKSGEGARDGLLWLREAIKRFRNEASSNPSALEKDHASEAISVDSKVQ